MSDIITWQESGNQLKVYYLFVFISMLYFLATYKKSWIYIYVILIFFGGLFGFVGKMVFDAYKILVLVFTLYLVIKMKPFSGINSKKIIVSFIIFSFIFILTSFINGDYFFIIFSQYSKYLIFFCIFFFLIKISRNEYLRSTLQILLYKLLVLQVILSFLKYIIIGPTESIVGSIGSQGGAMATSLPLLGFAFLWLKQKGKFEYKDWALTLGLMFIGFVSLKRAVWFTMPIFIAALFFYVGKRRINTKAAFFVLIVIPLIFYFGLRLNPFLNPEGKIWGKFDIFYAFDYAKKYSFGEDELKEKGTGRGGATLLLLERTLTASLSDKDFSGYGLRYIYAVDYFEFDKLKLGINHLGSATGLFQTWISNGIFGVISLLFFVFSVLSKTKNLRLKIIIFLFFSWEYFLYTGIVLRELSLSFLLLYIVVYSYQYDGATRVSKLRSIPKYL